MRPAFHALVALSLISAELIGAPPATKKIPVTDTYHGVEVVDDYRWLEDSSDESVRKWSDAQNAHAREFLDSRPHVAAIRARLKEIMEARTVGYSALSQRGKTLFAIKRQPPNSSRS